MKSSHHRAEPVERLVPLAPGTAAPGAATPSPLLGVGLVLAASTLWAANGVVSKAVLQSGLSTLRLVEIRCAGAAVLLVLLALARRPASLRLRRRELGFLALYGVVGVALVQWLYFVAIGRMPVSISLLLEFTAPLLVVLWVRFVRRQPVRPRVWLAVALTVAGLALVARVWAGLTLDGIGVLAALGAAVALAAYYLLGERGLGERDAVSLAAWSFVAAALFWTALLPWWSFPFGSLGGTTRVGTLLDGVPVWLLVGWVVVLGTVAPFVLVLAGLRRIGATRTTLLGTVEPPLAGLAAWVALGETLTAIQLVGGLVVLAGIVLAETARASHRPPPAPVAENLPC